MKIYKINGQIMKFWKSWPYWVRGGIIAVFLYLIVTFSLVPLGTSQCQWDFLLGEFCTPYYVLPAFYIMLPIASLLRLFGEGFWLPMMVFSSVAGSVTVGALLSFIVGDILGRIYGKIKNRKSVSSLEPKA